MMKLHDNDYAVVTVGTEVATWALFHPEDLAAKKDYPHDWWAEDREVVPYFKAGSLVMMDTGADGGFVLLLTSKPPERRWLRGASEPCEFRLTVTRGRIFCGNPGHFPNEDSDLYASERDEEASWLELPNANYRVLVWRLDFERMGVDADYVVQFSQVGTLADVSSPKLIPQLWPKGGDFKDDEVLLFAPLLGETTKKTGKSPLPLFPVHDFSLPIGEAISLFVGRLASIAAIDAALERYDGRIVVIGQKDANCVEPELSDLMGKGRVAAILKKEVMPDGAIKILIQAEFNIRLNAVDKSNEIKIVHFVPDDQE